MSLGGEGDVSKTLGHLLEEFEFEVVGGAELFNEPFADGFIAFEVFGEDEVVVGVGAMDAARLERWRPSGVSYAP